MKSPKIKQKLIFIGFILPPQETKVKHITTTFLFLFEVVKAKYNCPNVTTFFEYSKKI